MRDGPSEPSDVDEAALEDLFDDADLEDVDRDEVWSELEDGDADATDGDLFERLAEENPSQARSPEIDPEGDTAVVPKNRYCQRCEYFTAPPDVSCGHAGTTIEEVVDTTEFRVRNCPVVADRHGANDVLDME